MSFGEKERREKGIEQKKTVREMGTNEGGRGVGEKNGCEGGLKARRDRGMAKYTYRLSKGERGWTGGKRKS